MRMGPEVREAYNPQGSRTNRITYIQSRISAPVEDGVKCAGVVQLYTTPVPAPTQQDNLHTV